MSNMLEESIQRVFKGEKPELNEEKLSSSSFSRMNGLVNQVDLKTLLKSAKKIGEDLVDVEGFEPDEVAEFLKMHIAKKI
jgi:hypothetical protein